MLCVLQSHATDERPALGRCDFYRGCVGVFCGYGGFRRIFGMRGGAALYTRGGVGGIGPGSGGGVGGVSAVLGRPLLRRGRGVGHAGANKSRVFYSGAGLFQPCHYA